MKSNTSLACWIRNKGHPTKGCIALLNYEPEHSRRVLLISVGFPVGAPFSSKAVSSDPIFLLQEANFCNNSCSYLFFVQDWRNFLHPIFYPWKKSIGEDSQLFECLSKISHRSCFLIRPSRIYSLFSKDGDKIISFSWILVGWMLCFLFFFLVQL